MSSFECSLCSKTYKNSINLKEHVITKHGNEEHPCEKCGKVFSSRKRKRTHEENFHIEAKFECTQCDVVSKNNSNLTKHIQVKHDPNGNLSAEFICSFENCGKTFTTIRYLKNHEKSHQDRSIECPHCSKTYANPYALKSHVNRVHDKMKKVSCALCEKNFLTNQEKKSHMDLVHRKENDHAVKSHKCEFCSSSFYTPKKLKTHVERVHEKVKNFPCKYEGCEKMFTCTDNMNQHYSYEHVEAKFPCELCDKVFKTKQHLQTHEYYIHDIKDEKKENEILKNRLRNRVRMALKAQGGKKAEKTMNLVGCSVDVLRKWLEDKFTDGMSWENYGRGSGCRWEIDHKKPCAKFDLCSSENQKKCFHYTNLQPLWDKDNWAKGSSYVSDGEN